MPAPQERLITVSTWSILKVLAILLALGFLYLIRDILALVFGALFLAALMHPAARVLAKKRIPKGLTVFLCYILLFGSAVLAVGILLPTLIEQTATLLRTFGINWKTLSDLADSLQNVSQSSLTQSIQAGLQTLEGGQVIDAVKNLFSTFAGVFGGIVGLVLVLVMAYYAVVEEQEARNVFYNIVPEEYQEISATVLKRVEEKISRWLMGQLALGLIIGLMYYIALSIIGVKSALALAVFGGFMEFIPYLGPILGGIPALLIAFSQSPFLGLLTLGALILIQQLENHVIVPKVMQKAVGLNPLVSIVALLVGAKLFGIVGMLLAIPIATSIAVVFSELTQFTRRNRDSR